MLPARYISSFYSYLTNWFRVVRTDKLATVVASRCPKYKNKENKKKKPTENNTDAFWNRVEYIVSILVSDKKYRPLGELKNVNLISEPMFPFSPFFFVDPPCPEEDRQEFPCRVKKDHPFSSPPGLNHDARTSGDVSLLTSGRIRTLKA